MRYFLGRKESIKILPICISKMNAFLKGEKQVRVIMIIFSILFLTACQQLTAQPESTKSVDMYNAVGDMVGTAKLKEDPAGVKVELKVEGLTPGWHGLHIHEIGECEPPDFKSAGNHFNPDGKEHGLLNPKGPHLGDLPNVEADNSGKVEEEVIIQEATLLEGDKSLTEQGGTSIIITAEPDDGMTAISGNSGERIICGEIKGDEKEEDKEEPSDPTEEGEEEKEE